MKRTLLAALAGLGLLASAANAQVVQVVPAPGVVRVAPAPRAIVNQVRPYLGGPVGVNCRVTQLPSRTFLTGRLIAGSQVCRVPVY